MVDGAAKTGQAHTTAGKAGKDADKGKGRPGTAARQAQASGVVRDSAGDVDVSGSRKMHLVMKSERRGPGRDRKILAKRMKSGVARPVGSVVVVGGGQRQNVVIDADVEQAVADSVKNGAERTV